MEPKLKIDWDSAPAGFPFWCEAIGTSSSDYSGWHRQNENGDYVDLNGYIWSKVAEGKHFRVYRRPEPAPLITALGDCVSVMERELSGLAVIQPELKAAREALAAADAAPTVWSGEGLPPVGTVCEWRDDDAASWHKVEVRYLSKHTALLHFPGDGDGDTEGAFSPSCCQFRPLRTPEQIAAEERLNRVHAIEGIMLRGQEQALTITQIAAAIDDAGYRKDHRTADLLRALKNIATAQDNSTVLGLKQYAASTLAAVEGGAQ